MIMRVCVNVLKFERTPLGAARPCGATIRLTSAAQVPDTAMSKTNTLMTSTPSSPGPSPAPPMQEPEMSKEAMSTLKKKRIAHPGFLRMSIKCVCAALPLHVSSLRAF